MRIKPDILQTLSAGALVVDLTRVDNEQADDTEDNDHGMVEDIGDTEGNAEEDAYYPNPKGRSVSMGALFCCTVSLVVLQKNIQ